MPVSPPAFSRLRRHVVLASALLLAAGGGMAATSGAPATAPIVLVVGDSISAEFGLARGSGWVPLLQQRMEAEKTGLRVVNASISGDTTAGGRSRLQRLLQTHQPRVVVLELGANDALRGLPLAQTRDNLDTMARQAQQAGAKVLLLGMQVPPNYGADYTARFAQVFADVAKTRQVALVPFLLKGVADRPDALQWFQDDRIHPNAKAQPVLLDNAWGELKKLIK